jgi:hypothetical protein
MCNIGSGQSVKFRNGCFSNRNVALPGNIENVVDPLVTLQLTESVSPRL